MNHFLKKNFSTLVGAGGGSKGDKPEPPTLLPPKLGALSAINSYSYSESVDLLSEGPIEGIVNQNGQYLDGNRIFEGIYIDDTPIKKTTDAYNFLSRQDVSLSSLMEQITNTWVVDGEFVDKSFLSLTSENVSYDPLRSVNDPYQAYKFSSESLSAEIIYGRKNIAKALFKGRNFLRGLVDNYSDISDSEKNLAQSKLLRYDAYKTWTAFETSFLKDYPLSMDYPFFCVKINLGNFFDQTNEPVQVLDEATINKYTNTLLENDISNLVFQKLEASEIGKRRVLRNLSWVDMTTLTVVNGNTSLCGYAYIFGVQENGFPTQESILSLRNKVRNIFVVDFSEEKYNYTNVLAEIRNGEELQQPLGFFDRTYLDKQYGIKLLGPFANQGQALKLTDFRKASTSGVIEELTEQSTGGGANFSQDTINADEKALLETQWNLQGRLLKSGSLYSETLKDSKKFLRGATKKFIQDDNGYRCVITYSTAGGYNNFGPILLKSTVTITKQGSTFSYVITPAKGGGATGGSAQNISKDPLKTRYLAVSVLTAARTEGSLDTRLGNLSYSDWSTDSISQFDEEPNSVTHVVRNPNVSSVYVTMGIRALTDTAETTRTLAGTSQSVDAGTRIPSIVRFKIELGLQDSNGIEQEPLKTLVYQVIGLVESPALIDIGRVENLNNVPTYARFIQGSENVASELTLPDSTDGSMRYVRVTRTTHETYSSLIRREISLEKITEIIDNKFSYPNSAIVGVKLDSRTLSSLPPRSYDARLKRILVPSNYYCLHPDGKDKRFYATIADFNSASQEDKTIYDGNWDGTFKWAWSDNPAWILFDLLTNTRYGMGNYVDAANINIWELYRIGRFCDAVDDDGFFVGTASSKGGLEPRYSCNIIIADRVNVYDAIKNLVATFRGNVFYNASMIDFTDDRVKLPVAIFNNQNIKDGVFNYTNSRRDQQYNTIDIAYFDKDDGFKSKVEYVEDAEDIKKRGVLRTEIDTFGVTSRAQANRIGNHIIYSTINENQAVSFVAGREILSCKPGELIIVEDEMKSLQKNIGRILDIDKANKIVRLDEQFNSGAFLNEVTLFIPTGQRTYDDYYNLAVSPSKLAMNQLYSNDVPKIATFGITGYENLDYGCNLFLNKTGENISLINKARVGGIYSITLSGLKQEVYKLTTYRENSPLEYEVAAIKFDTGKFAQIESGQSLVDFYNNYPNVRLPTEGDSTIQQSNLYQLNYPTITSLTTGYYDYQADSIDVAANWTEVNGATHYDYELVTPKFRSITGRTTTNSVTFNDQPEAGRFTFRVTARNVNSDPNPISATYSSGITVLSLSAPVRANSIFAGVIIKQS